MDSKEGLTLAMSQEVAAELTVVPPFDLERTVAALRRRPNHLAEAFVEGEYRRMLTFGGQRQLIGVRQLAPNRIRLRAIDGPITQLEQSAAAQLLDVTLGLTFDLTPLYEALTFNHTLSALAHTVRGMKPPRFESLWVTLLSVVPFQQVSLAAGMAVLNRLIATLGSKCEYEGYTYYSYPDPKSVLTGGSTQLRACGLSQAKARTLIALAERMRDGDITDADVAGLDDTRAAMRLMELPGIGPWSAHLVLLRGYRRLSSFPAGDSGALRNARVLFGGAPDVAERTLRETLERLGPYKGYLYFLLLASRLLHEGIITGNRGAKVEEVTS